MKPRPQRQGILIFSLLIIYHVNFGFGRHLNDSTSRRNSLKNKSFSFEHSGDLKHTEIMDHRQIDQKSSSNSSETNLISGDKSSSSESLARFGAKKIPFRSYVPGLDKDSKNDLNDDDASFKNSDKGAKHYALVYSVLSPNHDVASDVTGQEGNNTTSLVPGYEPPEVLMDGRQVRFFIDEVVLKRNQNRIRRQRSPSERQTGDPDSTRRRRKRKHRHRLLLKSRTGGRKGKKHDRNFILKSDSEGHVITSASEVKQDWCRTVPFTHRVTAPRCTPKTVTNNFCYGQCNSFFIPQQRTSQGVAFQSYSNCKPDHLRWANVTLDCPQQNPPVVQRTVLIVESCRCIASDEPNDRELNVKIRHHARMHKNRASKKLA